VSAPATLELAGGGTPAFTMSGQGDSHQHEPEAAPLMAEEGLGRSLPQARASGIHQDRDRDEDGDRHSGRRRAHSWMCAWLGALSITSFTASLCRRIGRSHLRSIALAQHGRGVWSVGGGGSHLADRRVILLG
jgi:hypothetical protein